MLTVGPLHRASVTFVQSAFSFSSIYSFHCFISLSLLICEIKKKQQLRSPLRSSFRRPLTTYSPPRGQ